MNEEDSRIVHSEAEQVVEYHGHSANNRALVEALTSDTTFQELALAHNQIRSARERLISTCRVEEDITDVKDDVLFCRRRQGLQVISDHIDETVS